MKAKLLFVFIFCFVFSIKAQSSKSYSIVRSNLGISGSSKIITTSKGKYTVSQSIGQSSVIGTYTNNGYYLRQGYQQPIDKIKVEKADFANNDLSATVYPNPFEQSVSISFTEDMESEISVLVFNVAGKLIFSKKYLPSKIIDLNLNQISNGSYLLKVRSNNKLFNAKLIKK